MRNLMFIIYVGITFSIYCQSQSISKNFGAFYKIGIYDIQVPFAGQPYISPKQENGIYILTGYRYVCQKPTNDLNALYGIEVYDFKVDTLLKSQELKVDFIAGSIKLTYETLMNGKFINQEKDNFRGNYCIKQKFKVNVPHVGEVFMNSLFIFHKKQILRLYSFTPVENDENKRIYDFYESIKLE